MGPTLYKNNLYWSLHRMETYLPLLSKHNGDLKLQLKELTTNETMIALLSNAHKLAEICLT